MSGHIETTRREDPCGCRTERTEELDSTGRYILISETMTYCDHHRKALWMVRYSRRDASEPKR